MPLEDFGFILSELTSTYLIPPFARTASIEIFKYIFSKALGSVVQNIGDIYWVPAMWSQPLKVDIIIISIL